MLSLKTLGLFRTTIKTFLQEIIINQAQQNSNLDDSIVEQTYSEKLQHILENIKMSGKLPVDLDAAFENNTEEVNEFFDAVASGTYQEI